MGRFWKTKKEKNQKDKRFTFRYGHFVVVKSFTGRAVSVTAAPAEGTAGKNNN